MHAATPFRTASLSCPRCRIGLSHGELGFCERCRGVWIPEHALHDRIAAMHPAPAHVEWSADVRPAIPCVACTAPMQTLTLYAVPIDRCTHGIWFDRDELSAVLLESQRRREARPNELSAGDAAEASLIVADVSSNVALDVASSGVIETMLDVIGGALGALLDL